MKRAKGKPHRAFSNLNDQISFLYERVKRSYEKYDEELRKKENNYFEIGKDFFSKIVYKEHN